MTTLIVNEIFDSVQGEGPNTGAPTTFVRLQGCDMKPACSYCDTPYSYGPGGTEMSVAEIAAKVKMPNVCITGGEPLIQREGLLELLQYLHHRTRPRVIEVETNGMHDLPLTLDYGQRVRYLCDLKIPSSGTLVPFYNI
jgi:7-carboxy-7-deazaguanine synthase